MKETGPAANGEKMSIEGDRYLGTLEAFMRGVICWMALRFHILLKLQFLAELVFCLLNVCLYIYIQSFSFSFVIF